MINQETTTQQVSSGKLEGGLRTLGQKHKQLLPGKLLITVVTVVFNGATTIKEAIESVLAQSYDNVEYIIVDGGSTDGTLEIIKQFEHAIDYWLSEKDGGIYDAMNKGIALSAGLYVGMLNADDMLADENVLGNLAEILSSSKVDAVFSCLDIVAKDDKKKILRKCRIGKLSPGLLRIGIMPAHPTFYCKRTLLEEEAYKTDYRIAADFELLTRLCVRRKISWAFLNKVTVVMRTGGVSNRGYAARIDLNREVVRACRENGLYTNFLLLLLKLPIRLFELLK